MIIKDDKKLNIEGTEAIIKTDLTKILIALNRIGITKEDILLCVNLAYAEDQQKL